MSGTSVPASPSPRIPSSPCRRDEAGGALAPRRPTAAHDIVVGDAVDEFAVDVDEDDRLAIRSALHPDSRRHGARLEIESLPDAASRRPITPAARHGELVFGESFVRERGDHVARLCRPRLLVLGPVHLSALPKLVQPLESLHASPPWFAAAPRRARGARCVLVCPT